MTKINHAILLHSLYTETQQEFNASETQAIGRIKRYGQQRLVNIWRILAKDTMDTKIYDERVKVKFIKYYACEWFFANFLFRMQENKAVKQIVL